MRTITTRAELVELARELGTRPDWHEPDVQNIAAVVKGTHMNFDNAMPPGHWYGDPRHAELHVVLHRTVWEEGTFIQRDGSKREGRLVLGKPIAVVNLAMLFAWATGFDESTVELREDLERRQDAVIRRVVYKYFNPGDPQDEGAAFSLITELTRELPRVSHLTEQQALLAERVSTLNRWASKFNEQRTEAPVGPLRIMAAAFSDAFRQAAKHEQALYDSKQRHPSQRTSIPEYGQHD